VDGLHDPCAEFGTRHRHVYRTDAAVNPGKSGGPVFNEAGHVIAVTVSGLFTTKGASANINYLVPSPKRFPLSVCS